MYELIKTIILPPASLLIIAVLALVFRGASPGGRRLAAASLFLLYLLSTPLIADTILSSLEVLPALSTDGDVAQDSQAIVILSAESLMTPEYPSLSPGAMTLERLRYGARLQRATGLPVLVSGGVPSGRTASLASVMRQSLVDDFHVPVAWVEDQSQDTHQNAVQSATILRAGGISRVLLVTHAWHMPRAKLVFERAGLEVRLAPTAFTASLSNSGSGAGDGLRTLLPSAKAMQNSYFAFHEMLGSAFYRLAF
jgi:uncharacterized SAM-binding protein YcdF (DUF218 family)